MEVARLFPLWPGNEARRRDGGTEGKGGREDGREGWRERKGGMEAEGKHTLCLKR